MTNTTVNTASLLKPEQVGELIIAPLTRESTAFAVSTIVNIDSHEFRIPVLTEDPDTNWVAEGQEIPVDDAAVAEVVVTPKKVAGLTVISNELAADSSPEATEVISKRIVNSLKRKIDAAWFAAATTNGPGGLGAVPVTNVFAGAAYKDVDAFLKALAEAEKVGAQLTSFVTSPDTALALAQLRKGTGSNEPLLQADATVAGGRVICGVPLVTSPDAPNDGSVFGIPKSLVFAVIRKDAEVVIDSSAFFTSDRVAIRTVARVGFAYPLASAIVKINRAVAP